jgi:hypothetical protein
MESRQQDIGCFCCVMAGLIAFAVVGNVLLGIPPGAIISVMVMAGLFLVGVALLRD